MDNFEIKKTHKQDKNTNKPLKQKDENANNPLTKKKRKPDIPMEELLKNPDKLSNKFDDMDFESGSEYLSEGSDENVISDGKSDDQEEECIEQESFEKGVEKGKIVKSKNKNKSISKEQKGNKKVTLWDEKETKLTKDEVLEYDNEAYDMLHRSKVEWPCMSIDFVVPENFYPPMKNFYQKSSDYNLIHKDAFPYTCYLIAGSQTNNNNGYLYFMKWFNMQKTKYDDDPDMSEEESNYSDQEDPFMRFERVGIKGNVNRIKAMKNSFLTAYWSDNPTIEIADLRPLINELEINENKAKDNEDNEYKPTNKKKKIEPKKVVV